MRLRRFKRPTNPNRASSLTRQVIRFKALVMEPSVFACAERHGNLEAIYKKLEERRDPPF